MEATSADDLEAARHWWVFLVTGILWILFAWIVLSFDYDSVWAVAVFFGFGMIAGGIMTIMVGRRHAELALAARGVRDHRDHRRAHRPDLAGADVPRARRDHRLVRHDRRGPRPRDGVRHQGRERPVVAAAHPRHRPGADRVLGHRVLRALDHVARDLGRCDRAWPAASPACSSGSASITPASSCATGWPARRRPAPERRARRPIGGRSA